MTTRPPPSENRAPRSWRPSRPPPAPHLSAPTPMPAPSMAPRPLSIAPPEMASPPARTLGARVLPNLFGGVISATLIISFNISLCALIFAGPVAPHLAAGIGVVLASTVVVAAIVAWKSSFLGAVAGPQDTTGVILALIAASIGRQIPPGSAALPTLLAAMGVTSLATGALFFGLGSFRLGKFVRFIPYPVVGGFLAGTGWLLVQGSLSVMSGVTLTFGEVPRLFAAGVPWTWIPGVAFGFLIAAVQRRFKHFLVLPGLLVGGIAIFYAVVGISGMGASGAMARGALLGPFPDGSLVPPITPASLGQIDWSFLRTNAGNIAACTVLAAISVLLNATGLELATEQDLDLDRELRITGIANALVGFMGGVPGYLSLSESTLNFKAGARSRAPGLITAVLSLVTLFAGTSAIAYFPKPVLGGLLLFLGLSFLIDTVYESWFRLPRGEYGLVIFILFVVVTVGFLEGVGVGIVVSSFLFAINYARIDVVKHAISGAGLRSKAGRSPADEALLQQTGGHIHVVQLQGYLFFGTAYLLLQRVKQRLQTSDPLPAYFVVLDFRHVDGLDSSAVVSFSRMRRLAEQTGAVLILTQLPPNVRRQLARGGCLDDIAPALDEAPRAVRVFSDLDHGLEWCERQLLATAGDSRPSSEVLAGELESIIRHRDLVDRLLEYLDHVEAPAGLDLYKKGDLSGDLYLIESGELEAFLDLSDGRVLRLRTMGAGSVVGESGLYLGARRSASVRTTRPSVLYRLSLTALERMTLEAPELAAAFHKFVATHLADRIVNTTSAAQMLFY